MVVGLDHPLVSDYLRRLDEAAASLAPGRRGELVEEIRGHVGDALVAVGEDEAAVRGVLDRLGSPEEIVAAEREDGAAPAGYAPPLGGTLGPSGGIPDAMGSPAPQRLWGPIEIVAVVGLTLGAVVVPFLGPIVGLVCAWASQQWTRREKIVATVWTAFMPLLFLMAGVGLFAVRSSSSTVEIAPAPVVVEQPAQPVPSLEVSP